MRAPFVFAFRAAIASVMLAGCDSPTDPRPSASTSVNVDGVSITARINSAAEVVFTLINNAAAPRTLGFGDCGISLMLVDRTEGEVRLDTRDRGCFTILHEVTVPA